MSRRRGMAAAALVAVVGVGLSAVAVAAVTGPEARRTEGQPAEAAAATSGMTAATASTAAAGAAMSAATTEVIEGDHLRIVSVADWASAASMRPGVPVRWDVTVSAEAPEPGTIDVGISGTGETALVVDVRGCAEAWHGDECPSEATSLREEWALPLDGRVRQLTQTPDTVPAHLRIDVTLAAGTVPGDDTEVRVRAEGAGDSIDVVPGPDPGAPDPSGELPRTGSDAPALLLLVGAAAVLGGAVLVARARTVSRKDER